MTAIAWLLPVALGLGLLGLLAFNWALRSGQMDDLEGAAWRALDDAPLSKTPMQDQAATEAANGSGSR
ncbi:MAG: cbb3-type cytochrome oxidase assembly protein CcoS [Hyphomicrobiaceae bacterium]